MFKIINDLVAILFCIIIIIASVFVGTPIVENTKIITLLVGVLFSVYIIYRIVLKGKIKNQKNNINIIDICIFILCLCPFIPIFARTSVNIEDSLNVAGRYITLFLIYIMTKLIVKNNNKYVKWIKFTIIFAGIIGAIIGFDNMTYQKTSIPLYNIGIPFINNIENRMFGSFGYANTFAMSMLISLILNLDNTIKENKKIYNIFNFIFVTCILLSYSKAVYILSILCVILYCISLRKKELIIKTCLDVALCYLMGIVYSSIFSDMYQEKQYLGIWIVLIEFSIIATLISFLTEKINVKIRINKLNFVKIVFGISIIIISSIFIGLKFTQPLNIFMTSNQTEQVKYKISNIEPECKYNFLFNVKSKSLYNNKIYQIVVVEEDKYYQTIKEHEIELSTYLGEKNIEFTTTPETVEFALVFKSKNCKEQKGLTINSVKINGKEYTLKYKYLPANLVNKIRNFNFKSLSVTERLTFYKDAIKLIKRNPFTGIGGNGWLYKYDEVKTYNYFATQVHSYLLQLFLEFGIIAIADYLIIIFFILKYIVKNNKIMESIKIALIAIMVHSSIDFDLSFMNMAIYMFIFISLVSECEIERN